MSIHLFACPLPSIGAKRKHCQSLCLPVISTYISRELLWPPGASGTTGTTIRVVMLGEVRYGYQGCQGRYGCHYHSQGCADPYQESNLGPGGPIGSGSLSGLGNPSSIGGPGCISGSSGFSSPQRPWQPKQFLDNTQSVV